MTELQKEILATLKMQANFMTIKEIAYSIQQPQKAINPVMTSLQTQGLVENENGNWILTQRGVSIKLENNVDPSGNRFTGEMEQLLELMKDSPKITAITAKLTILKDIRKLFISNGQNTAVVKVLDKIMSDYENFKSEE
jgi:predicted transcriptional regulator